jgi:hypothetical protein
MPTLTRMQTAAMGAPDQFLATCGLGPAAK